MNYQTYHQFLESNAEFSLWKPCHHSMKNFAKTTNLTNTSTTLKSEQWQCVMTSSKTEKIAMDDPSFEKISYAETMTEIRYFAMRDVMYELIESYRIAE